jgi:hypothetical protein
MIVQKREMELPQYAVLQFRANALALERLGQNLPVLLKKNLHLPFGLVQFFPARGGKLHPFLEQCQGTFKRNVTLFQFPNNSLKTLNAVFKFWQGGYLLKQSLHTIDGKAIG